MPSTKPIKKAFVYFFFLLIIFQNIQGQAIAKIDSVSAYPGDTISIAIHVTNLNNVNSLSFVINYCPAVLTYLNIHNVHPALSCGNLLVFELGTTIKSSWICPGDSVTISSGILYEMVFIYNGDSCCLHGNNSFIWIDGCVTMMQPKITGHVMYDDTFTPHQSITNTLLRLFNSGGTLIDSTYTDQNGNYLFTNLPNGTYSIRPYCTKPWGGGNSIDALAIIYHFAGQNILTGLRRQAADVDASAFISTLDALYVMQRFVMMVNSFPLGDWVFEDDAITVNGADVVHDFKGLCVGDVNGSYQVP